MILYLLLSGIFIVFGFLVFRVVVRNDYLKKDKLSTVSYSLEVIVFAIHANMMYLFNPAKWPTFPDLPENFILKIVASIVLCFGVIILLISWFSMGTKESFGQDKNNLRTNGIYSYTRNPQLVGYGILILSIVIIYFNWESVGWFLQFIIISYFMIQSEEEFLKHIYGIEYEKYCAKVPRIIRLIK